MTTTKKPLTATKSDETKTIIFSVSAFDTFKQFFFFPGSVFNLLKEDVRHGKVRIVFVMPKRKGPLQEQLNHYCKDVRDQIIIESVEYVEKETRLQRLFRFWFSYLVYTGTTKTIATMGMRIEDAPGAGRLALAPIKFFISRTFGKSTLVKRSLVPWLYNRIYSARPFADIFEIYQPDLVFTPNLFRRFDMELLAHAKRVGVRNIGMTTNWDHFDKYYLPIQADTLLVQTEQIKSFAMKYQAYEEERLVTVGYPYLDFVISAENAVGQAATLTTLSFPDNARYILYVAGSMYCPDEPDIIEEVLRWIDNGDLGENVYLAIRPYFGGRGKDLDFDEMKFQGFKDHPRVSFIMDKFWEDIDKTTEFINILRCARVVMAIYSTAALEAVALDRPSLTFAFDGYKQRPFNHSIKRFELREHFKDILESGGQQRAESFDHLKSLLQGYLEDQGKDAEKRENLRKRAVYPIGNASRTIRDTLYATLQF